MTWYTDINNGPSGDPDADAMWRLISRMMAAGWSKVMDSDGTTYSASGTQVTGSNTGTNGLDNDQAWVRMQDPGGVREVVWQRGPFDDWWAFWYSAKDKFTVGNPTIDFETPPIANDMEGWPGSNYIFDQTAGDCYYHVAASDVAVNGVYPFWMVSVYSSDQSVQGHVLMDGFITPITDDDDACWMSSGEEITSLATLGPYSKCWMNYGKGPTATPFEEWDSPLLMWQHASTENFELPNPHDSYRYVNGIWVNANSFDIAQGMKGQLATVKFNQSDLVYGDIIEKDLGESNYLRWLLIDEIALPGWPDGVTRPAGNGGGTATYTGDDISNSVQVGQTVALSGKLLTPTGSTIIYANTVYDTVLSGGSWQRWRSNNAPDTTGSGYAAATGGDTADWKAGSYAFEVAYSGS